MQRGPLRNFFYKFAWDTRCRNVDVAAILRPLITRQTTIVDVGCGDYGISAFLDHDNITGVDILPEENVASELKYIKGSILDLPFDERQFDIAVSVDVLEHLPAEVRHEAVRQLVKVAKDRVLVTFPCGKDAREIDENFEQELQKRGQPPPDWLEEHLRGPYPDSDEIVGLLEAEAARLGRSISTRVRYSENTWVAKLLRRAAIRSKFLYLSANLSAGLLMPLMPRPNAGNAYRAVVIAEFSEA